MGATVVCALAAIDDAQISRLKADARKVPGKTSVVGPAIFRRAYDVRVMPQRWRSLGRAIRSAPPPGHVSANHSLDGSWHAPTGF